MTTENKLTLKPSPDIQRVPLELLSSDPDNIRKNYDAASLAELALSLKEQGLIQNLECGPDGVVHLGNRRLRALQEIVVPELQKAVDLSRDVLAKLEAGDDVDERAFLDRLLLKLDGLSHPIVRVLGAEEMRGAKMRQVIENLQREDVTAFDEAEGYALMLELKDDKGNAIHTPETIAKRIGKGQSGEYVRQRLKIRRAPVAMMRALEAGEIGVWHCLMVGRIPSQKLRAEAAKKVLKPQYSDRVLTKRETIELVRRDYMVALRKPPFDPEDGDLIPGAGPCSTCPSRSGNDPSLAGDLQVTVARPGVKGASGSSAGVSPDICTNPACFRKKGDACWKAVEETAGDEGKHVMSPELAADEFGGYDGQLRHNSKYVDLADKPAAHMLGHYDDKKAQKWKVLLRGTDARVILARHPKSGRIHELVEMSVAKLAVELKAAENNEVSIFQDAKKNSEVERRERAKERAASVLKQLVAIAVFDALSDAMSAGEGEFIDAGPGVNLKRGALLILLEITLDSSADACGFFGKWLELERAPKPEGSWMPVSDRDYLPVFMEMINNRVPEYSHRDLLVWIVLASIAGGVRHNGADCRDLGRFCDEYGVDIDALAERVTDEVVAENKRLEVLAAEKKRTAKKKAVAKKKAPVKKKVPGAKKKAVVKKKVAAGKGGGK